MSDVFAVSGRECPECRGSGCLDAEYPELSGQCPTCDGDGVVADAVNMGEPEGRSFSNQKSPSEVLRPYIDRIRALGYSGFVRLSVHTRDEACSEEASGYWNLWLCPHMTDTVSGQTWADIEAGILQRVSIADCDPVFMGF